MSGRNMRWAVLSAVAMLTVLLLVSASPVGTGEAAQEAPVQPGCWQTHEPPRGGGYEIRDISVLPSGEAWAVGYIPTSEGGARLILRFNGASWEVAHSGRAGVLGGVAAIAPDNVWAVGGMVGEDIYTSRPLTMHWNGREWREVEVQVLAGRSSWLASVSGSGPDDVWAVGYVETPLPPPYSGSRTRQALFLHWDGREWSRVNNVELPGPAPSPTATPGGPPPPPHLQSSEVNAVASVSRSEAWAVGYGTGDRFLPAIWRWDGSRWSAAALPDVPGGGILNDVAVIAPDNVWVVGREFDGNPGYRAWPLTMHWDGSEWSQVHAPSASEGDRAWNALSAVAALPNGEVWAVGEHYVPRGPQSAFAVRWDGRAWRPAPGPDELSDVHRITAAAGGGRLWVASYSVRGATRIWSFTPPPCLPPVQLPGEGSRTFPETGKTVKGIFLDYWERNGGLMQQGFPITEAMGEMSELDGKTYTVQYFERAVFEYHPEQADARFKVLLSHLGSYLYKRNYPQGAPNQRPNTSPGSVLVPETGKRLGGRFLEYWRVNGGLMQQGYPISDEFTEVSETDGKPYTVQYFERAVVELHPENKPPYDVLLSHLGRFHFSRKYEAGPPPGLDPAPEEAVPGAAAVGGRYSIWQSGSGETSAINAYDLDSRTAFTVTNSPTNKSEVATDGRYVTWVQDCPPYCHRVRVFDLQSRAEREVFPPEGKTYGWLGLERGKLLYREYTAEVEGIYSLDLATGARSLVAGGGIGPQGLFQPVIASGVFLYSQANEEQTEWTLHAVKLDGSTGDRVIARTQNPFTGYHASGELVIYGVYPTIALRPEPQSRLYIYDLQSGVTREVSQAPGYSPFLSGRVAVWVSRTFPSEGSAGGPLGSIQAYDTATGRAWTLRSERGTDVWIVGVAEGGHVVFTEEEYSRGPIGTRVLLLR